MTQKSFKIAQKIVGTKGKFFSVEFIKKDGSLRKLTGRLGVKSHLRGGQSTVKSYDNIITVFDVNKGGYRNVDVDRVTAFNGQKV